MLIDAYRHEAEFEFELMSYLFEDVKLALEQEGYSVHRAGPEASRVVAVRVKPDLSPCLPRAAQPILLKG